MTTEPEISMTELKGLFQSQPGPWVLWFPFSSVSKTLVAPSSQNTASTISAAGGEGSRELCPTAWK